MWACGPPNATKPSGQNVMNTSHILVDHGESWTISSLPLVVVSPFSTFSMKAFSVSVAGWSSRSLLLLFVSTSRSTFSSSNDVMVNDKSRR